MNEAFRAAQDPRTMAKQYRIASVPADGIGPEVISAGLEVLDAVASRDGGFKLVVDHYDWGSNWYRKHGVFMPPDGLAWLRTADAIYFGAVGDRTMSHCGVCGCKSVRAWTNMPTCGRRVSWPA
jgi:isocitrate/isopropylmalate dehydrogenase